MATPEYQPLSITPVQYSLTEGTSIPAPPDSPPPRPPTPSRVALDSHANGDSAAQTETQPTANGARQSMAPPAVQSPPPPPQQQQQQEPNRRMSSVRKLLGIRKSNASWIDDVHSPQNGSAAGPLATKKSLDSMVSSRPGSPYTALSSGTSPTSPRSPGLARKKSAGWFGSAGAGRRRSGMVSPIGPDGLAIDADAEGPPRQSQSARVPRGPPPPTIPEFREFKSLDGELDSSLGGGEIFKDIN